MVFLKCGVPSILKNLRFSQIIFFLWHEGSTSLDEARQTFEEELKRIQEKYKLEIEERSKNAELEAETIKQKMQEQIDRTNSKFEEQVKLNADLENLQIELQSKVNELQSKLDNVVMVSKEKKEALHKKLNMAEEQNQNLEREIAELKQLNLDKEGKRQNFQSKAAYISFLRKSLADVLSLVLPPNHASRGDERGRIIQTKPTYRAPGKANSRT